MKNIFLKRLNVLLFKPTVLAKQYHIFYRQFSTLINSGLPIIYTCDMLAKTQPLPLSKVISNIKLDLLAGKTFTSSLQQYPHIFPEYICHLIHIGEHTGKLDFVLATIADQQEKQWMFRKKIQQALFYPSIILAVACIITLMMFLFIIPKFAVLFADFHDKLPLLTLLIFSVAQKINHHLFFLSTGLPLLCFLLYKYKNNIIRQKSLFFLLAKLPKLKAYFDKFHIIYFARNLSLLFQSGISLTESIVLAATTTGNNEFIKVSKKLEQKVSAGLPLYYAIELFPIFPLLMVQMIKVGEETGKLDVMLDKIADFFAAELEQVIHYITQLLEPLIMLLLGVLIGGLILGMYLPIFKLGMIL